jgi:ribonucleoside-diphosphate reductase alpha chain
MRPLPPMVVESAPTSRRERGLRVVRFFTRPGRHPVDLVEWERRTLPAPGPSGQVAVEVPRSWSASATRIAGLRLAAGAADGHHYSLRQTIARVAATVAAWGREGRYLADAEATAFEHELAHLLIHQMLSFGFPTWLGIGLDPEPQCCSCPTASGAGHAARLSDDFLGAVEADDWWETGPVHSGAMVGRERAREALRRLASGAAGSGELQVQFDDTVDRWNTCAAWGRVNATNPCAAYAFLDDTAAQPASLNLLRFLDGAGRFRGNAFRHAVDVAVLALEIMVSATRYPTARFAARTRELRPLALGYANLGALLMASGLAYDSDAGRAVAAALTSLMTGEALLQSARVAASLGSFAAYPANRTGMLAVVERHREAARGLRPGLIPVDLLGPAVAVWDEALALGTRSGFRNAQVTALAPNPAAATLMGCVAPGAEPLPAPGMEGDGARTFAELFGRALERLGYGPTERRTILDDLESTREVADCNRVDPAHLPVLQGGGAIPPARRLQMVGAVQPFLSAAAAATLVLPAAVTADAVESLLLDAWRFGVRVLGLRYETGSDGTEGGDARAFCQLP